MPAPRRALSATASLSLLVGGLAFLAAVPASAVSAPGSEVFINELHYDNTDTDSGELVEIAAPAGTDLAGWSIVLYNGNGGASYGTTALNGTVPGAAGDVGTVATTYGVNGLQNGSPDGVALVKDGTVVQFLSYEGVMTATNGPAAGQTSTDIGVAEDGGTPVGHSLQLTGTGRTAGDFTWAAPAAATPGATNTGQTFGNGGGDPEPPVEVVTIAEVQGTGAASPLQGRTVTTEGVVTAVYATGGKNGFVIQTEGATPGEASHGLFVHTYNGTRAGRVAPGDRVEVAGEVVEYFGLTEINAATDDAITVTGTGSITPAAVAWPATDAARESLESMLLDLSGQQFTVTDNYSTNRYGEVGLATGDRPLVTPTEIANPGLDQAGYDAAVADNAARGVILDDGATTDYQNNAAAKSQPLPWIDRDTTARVGAAATLDAPVVVDYGFSKWRVQPTTPVTGVQPDLVTFEDTRPDNARPQDVGGDITLATFNVLNYFNTTGEDWVSSGRGSCTYFRDRAGDEVTNQSCTPGGPRGAAEDDDLQRQQAKIVAAINGLDASVVSLEEIENSLALGEPDRDDALAELTGALNAAAGSQRWAYVPSPSALPASEDVIRTALIYDPAVLELEGESVILDDPAFSNARQPLAQAFRPVGTTETTDAFAVVVNHFKSKGSACAGEPNGPQGNCNQSRVGQARALAGFADDFAVQRELEQVFLTGDFNSYTQEDPMLVLEQAGYTVLKSETPDEWSYSFSGQSGSLDHVLANDAALAEVQGVDLWEINANEAIAFEYSRFNYNVTDFFAPDAFRASDHNPELVGIDVRDAADLGLELSPTSIKQKKEVSTATVAVPGGTGVVIFLVDGQEVGREGLVDGVAQRRIGPFRKGTYDVTVQYAGDADTLPATASAQLVVGNGKS